MKQYWARAPLMQCCDGNDNDVDIGMRHGLVRVCLAADESMPSCR